MSKQEFIEKLRSSLSGQIPGRMVEENVAYYEDYINYQIRLGQSEDMVMQSLGDPRLIAKSIITANADEETAGTGKNGNGEWTVNAERFYAENRKQGTPKVIRVRGWVSVAITIAIFVLVVGAIFSLISFLLPVIVVGGIVLFLVKLFRDWLN